MILAYHDQPEVIEETGPSTTPLEQIKDLTSNPVTTLINTHSHHDHMSGNVAFAPTVEIVTHENTKANMAVMRPYSGRTEPPRERFLET